MKNVLKLMFVISICSIGLLNVQAIEQDGMVGPCQYNFTEKEYEYIKDFYGEDYLNRMTVENYKWIKSLNIDENGIKFNFSVDNSVASPNGSFVSSSNESLGISRSCNTSFCSVTVLARWLKDPAVRSYDVIGGLLVNTSFHNDERSTIVTSSTSGGAQSNYRVFSNGLGNSVKLPDTGTNVMIEQHFYVEPKGRVYASYQHAMRNTTLATSKLYNLSLAGYGAVFSFTGAAANDLYNGFAGVNIDM